VLHVTKVKLNSKKQGEWGGVLAKCMIRLQSSTITSLWGGFIWRLASTVR